MNFRGVLGGRSPTGLLGLTNMPVLRCLYISAADRFVAARRAVARQHKTQTGLDNKPSDVVVPPHHAVRGASQTPLLGVIYTSF